MPSSAVIRRKSVPFGLALLTLLANACGAAEIARTTTTSTTAKSKTYVKLVAGGLTVTPSSGLHDGQQVVVAVKGFLPNRKCYLSECLSTLEANVLGCGLQLALQPFGPTNGNGAGVISFTVRSDASTGPLIPTTQTCTGECVIVATSGANGAFSFAPLTVNFSAPTVSGSASPCTNADVGVADSGGGAGLGHEDRVLVFTNASRAVCTLQGYPGVAGLNAAGEQVAQASRTPSGYMGGLLPGASGPAEVTLAPGQAASAVVEGTDTPQGSQPCPTYPSLLVTPPDLTRSVRVAVTGSGGSSSGGLAGCSALEIHPVVPGTSGSDAAN